MEESELPVWVLTWHLDGQPLYLSLSHLHIHTSAHAPDLGWAWYSGQVSKRQKRERGPHEGKTESRRLGAPEARRGSGAPYTLTSTAGFQKCGRTGDSVSCIAFLVTCHVCEWAEKVGPTPGVGRVKTDVWGWHLTHWPEKCHLRMTGGNTVSLETSSKDEQLLKVSLWHDED